MQSLFRFPPVNPEGALGPQGFPPASPSLTPYPLPWPLSSISTTLGASRGRVGASSSEKINSLLTAFLLSWLVAGRDSMFASGPLGSCLHLLSHYPGSCQRGRS